MAPSRTSKTPIRTQISQVMMKTSRCRSKTARKTVRTLMTAAIKTRTTMMTLLQRLGTAKCPKTWTTRASISTRNPSRSRPHPSQWPTTQPTPKNLSKRLRKPRKRRTLITQKERKRSEDVLTDMIKLRFLFIIIYHNK